ncbi:hypothetical protein D7243_22685 [Stutzerimonas stutzeri]|nr:hypothetical protein [Stutzerimonas stutzeri]
MSAFYDEMAGLAAEMIAEFGQVLTLRREVEASYDPATGQMQPGATEEQPITALVRPASKGTVEAFDNKLVNGTLIESNIRALKIVADGLLWPPGPGCVVEYEGHEWKMLGATPTNPAGTALIYSASIMR